MNWEESAAGITARNDDGEALAVIIREWQRSEKCRAYDTHKPGAPLGRFDTIEEAKAAVERHFAMNAAAAA